MIAGLSAEVLGALGPTALVSLIALLIFTGRLIPLRTHLREMAQADRRAEDWRAAATTERARADLLATQLTEILDALKQPREAA